jgi:multisubunit Na+/H+ antiporter MnhB subunit
MQIQKIHLFIVCGAIFVYLLLNVLDNEKYDFDLEENQKNALVAIVVGILGFSLVYIKPTNFIIDNNPTISNSFIPTHL